MCLAPTESWRRGLPCRARRLTLRAVGAWASRKANIEGGEFGLNVPNTEKYVSNLPEDAIVEVPVKVDGNGIHPIKVGPLPEGIAAMCRQQISIQNLLVEAYAERSKRALLSALLLEPTVDSPNRAEQMMEELLARQTAYLPEFT